MLFRKIQRKIKEHFTSGNDAILMLDGARQTGKTFIIRDTCKQLFKNFVEINMVEDFAGDRLFEKATTVVSFYERLSAVAGNRLGTKENTVVFLDEIQEYPHLLTLLKFLREDGRFTYVVSGSQLDIALRNTTSLPVGSVSQMRMYPLDFEEFLLATGMGEEAIAGLRTRFDARESLDDALHQKVLEEFRRYLVVGGLPACVNTYIATRNIAKVRDVQTDIRNLYGEDASKYDREHKLKIKRIYAMVPSLMENVKKRVVAKDIEGKKGARFTDYADEFDYLVNSGIALDVKAVANPVFPLVQTVSKNLLKLYMNDVGLLTGVLYGRNIKAVLDMDVGINLGAVYETVAAMELRAHGHELYYYDNRQNGEVDFLVDDYDSLAVRPVEIKSGKDYRVHSAINRFLAAGGYGAKEGFVFSNSGVVRRSGALTYFPIYNLMFL